MVQRKTFLVILQSIYWLSMAQGEPLESQLYVSGKSFPLTTVTFHNSEPLTFLNASLLLWEADFKECDELFTEISSHVSGPNITRPVGLYVHNYPQCFPDDIARLYKDVVDFIITGRDQDYKPTGLMALVTRRIDETTPIPVYETDLPDRNISSAVFSPSLRVDVIPMPNPYEGPGVLVPYTLIIGTGMGLNLAKLGAIYNRFTGRPDKDVMLTPSIVLLGTEALSSLICMFQSMRNLSVVLVVFIDFDGFFGIYSTRVYYPILMVLPFLGNISTVVLLYAFSSAVKDIDISATTYKAQLIASAVFLVVSVFAPVYDSYGFITFKVKQSPVVTALNVFGIMYFSGVFSFLFIRAKGRVVKILEASKDGVVTAEQKKIQRMSEYMYYSAACMIAYVISGVCAGVALAQSSGVWTVLITGLTFVLLTLVGFAQVLSLPTSQSAQGTGKTSKNQSSAV